MAYEFYMYHLNRIMSMHFSIKSKSKSNMIDIVAFWFSIDNILSNFYN